MSNLIIGEDYGNQESRFHVSGVEKKTESRRGDEQENTQKKSIYAGDLFTNQDLVSQKFALKQKSAIKRVLDQFKQDLATDDEMKGLTEREDTLGDIIREATRELQGVEERRGEIRERYNVSPDSQEQKDLELMQKANEALKHPFDEAYQLTDEEKERLDNMPPVTAYQQEMLECDEEEKQYLNKRRSAQIDIIVDRATVNATQKALLKVHPMVDAQVEAKKIMENALREMSSGLLQEGVDKIDEDMEEVRAEMAEDQEEALEKKIEQEKLKEEDAEREEAAQELEATLLSAEMQAVSGSQKAMDNLQANVKSLVQEQVMLDVDLKGLRVNQQV